MPSPTLIHILKNRQQQRIPSTFIPNYFTQCIFRYLDNTNKLASLRGEHPCGIIYSSFNTNSLTPVLSAL